MMRCLAESAVPCLKVGLSSALKLVEIAGSRGATKDVYKTLQNQTAREAQPWLQCLKDLAPAEALTVQSCLGFIA